jgi:hypothetical protein
MNAIKPKSNRGGRRPGAGRKPGSRNAATAAEIKSIADLAKLHAPEAVAVLVEVMTRGTSEAARVTAATQLLDRAYGKPASAQVPDGTHRPIQINMLPIDLAAM